MIIATGWETVCRIVRVDAIHFVEREAAAYDAEAVKQNMLKSSRKRLESRMREKDLKAPVKPFAGGCPGTRMRMMNREESMQNAESEEEGEGDGEKRE